MSTEPTPPSSPSNSSTPSSAPSSDVPHGQRRSQPPVPVTPDAPSGRNATDPGGTSRTAAPEKAPGTKAPATKPPVTRAAVVWVAVAVALVILVLLIIFFIQNQDQVKVHFLGFEGSLALGIALFIAAVGGGILVAIAGGARIVQLRIQERRNRKRSRS